MEIYRCGVVQNIREHQVLRIPNPKLTSLYEVACHSQYYECTHCPEILPENFENAVNCSVDIQEDIKCYQDTLSYTSSKVDYSMEEGVYMLPSDMNLKIKSGTAGYNNEILLSDSGFSLGKTIWSMLQR